MRELILDSNLLVLLVVGVQDRSLISKHKRTRQYTEDDFDLLLEFLANFDRIVVTPNILTECSNLLAQDASASGALRQGLKSFIESPTLRERVRASIDVVKVSEFPRLGLTDAGILDVFGRDLPVLTADLQLYLAAYKRNQNAAFNFNHYRFA